MSDVERVVDPYPQARETINATCSAMIAAGEVLHRDDLSDPQKQELARMVLERSRALTDLANSVVQA